MNNFFTQKILVYIDVLRGTSMKYQPIYIGTLYVRSYNTIFMCTQMLLSQKL